MTDILLTHGYFLSEDEKERRIMKPYPPLGLLYLSSYLQRSGFQIEVFDTTFSSPGDLFARLKEMRGVLGIYTNLMTRQTVLSIIRVAKEFGWTVILGGPESAGYPSEYLDRGADVVVLGEGEETVAELLPALSSRGPHRLHEVAGVVFRDEAGRIVTNPGRPQIADLDTVPWPDREKVDILRYVDVWRRHHGRGSVSLITARGCPYRCRWCSHAVFGFTHRRRSVKDCADEVEHILDAYRPEQLWYSDDVFTIHQRWFFDYARELKNRGIQIPFETISRADRMMSDAILDTLAEMGCYRIWIGSESGSQRILDAMERGVTVEEVQWATRQARKRGIEVGMFLMWGYQGETLEDIEATVEHVKSCNPDVFLTTVAYPIKDTPYFETVAQRVSLPRGWEGSTDRDYRIEGRPSGRYYRLADQWLADEVESCRLAASDTFGAARKRLQAERSRHAMLTR